MIFKAPAYKDQMITNEVNVLLKLIVPSDDPFDANTNLQEKYESEVVEFVYTPLGKLIDCSNRLCILLFGGGTIYFKMPKKPDEYRLKEK